MNGGFDSKATSGTLGIAFGAGDLLAVHVEHVVDHIVLRHDGPFSELLLVARPNGPVKQR